MTVEEINRCARELLRPANTESNALLEHIGGYRPQELKDYNRYSDVSSLPPADDEDDEMVYITTL